MIESILGSFISSVLITAILSFAIRKAQNPGWTPRSVWDVISKPILVVLFIVAVLINFFSMKFMFVCGLLLIGYLLFKDKLPRMNLPQFDDFFQKDDKPKKNKFKRMMEDW